MKVTYLAVDGNQSKAYLNQLPLPDGSYTGVNKHTDEPIHVKWSNGPDEWVAVCAREALPFNPYTEDSKYGPPDPNCICALPQPEDTP